MEETTKKELVAMPEENDPQATTILFWFSNGDEQIMCWEVEDSMDLSESVWLKFIKKF